VARATPSRPSKDGEPAAAAVGAQPKATLERSLGLVEQEAAA